MSVFGYENEILDTNSVFTFNVDTWLNGEDHTRLSLILVDRTDVAVFVVFLSDKMTKTDLPVFAIAFFIDVIPCLCVDITEA